MTKPNVIPLISNDREIRAGAQACLEALRIIERIAEAKSDDETPADSWWADGDAAVMAMRHAAGCTDGFMAGFVSVFAEYAMFINRTGTPHLYRWKPEATMSDVERLASRQENFAE